MTKKKKSRKMSEEHRQRIAEAQKKRWAEKKASEVSPEIVPLPPEAAEVHSERQTVQYTPKQPTGEMHQIPETPTTPHVPTPTEVDRRGTSGFVSNGVHQIHSGQPQQIKNRAAQNVFR